MEYFYRVLTQLEIFSVMILLGVFAVKTNAMNEKSLGDLSKMIMRLILPVMIFHKSINGATKADIMSSSSEVILSSFLMFGVLFMVGYLLKKTFSLTGNYGRVYQAAAMFGNVGFIGIPLILGILPERGMLYMALFFIVDQIVLWSIGYYMTLPEEKLAHASLKSNIKNIMSPAMIGIVIAIIFILTEARWAEKLMFVENEFEEKRADEIKRIIHTFTLVIPPKKIIGFKSRMFT